MVTREQSTRDIIDELIGQAVDAIAARNAGEALARGAAD
jgi:hypothetical protein